MVTCTIGGLILFIVTMLAAFCGICCYIFEQRYHRTMSDVIDELERDRRYMRARFGRH